MEKTTKIKDHWFWGTALQNKGIYVQVAMASILINIFALMSAFYIMTVYDRVLPNNAMESLLALTIGIAFVTTALAFVIGVLFSNKEKIIL